MCDPRMILANELQLLGLTRQLALTIALDAGSSQVIVDEDYLRFDIKFDKKIDVKKVLNIIQKFYSGDLVKD